MNYENEGQPYVFQFKPEWTGLTEDEVALIVAECAPVSPSDFYFYKAIEAKLKEKNT
jgi:hypothetical protein